MTEQVMVVLVGILATGGFNAVVTVAVINSRLKYIERDIVRLEANSTRAHERLDGLRVA